MSAAPKYHKAFDALGDPTRRTIFEKLADGPLSVVHIADGIPVSRPAVSQHLKVLREARLITMEQKGTRSIYRVDPDGVRAMCDYLDRFWDEALHNVKALAEKKQRQNK